MKRKHVAAILVALASAMASCGGDDTPQKPTPAAGTSPAERAEQPPSEPDRRTEETSSQRKAKRGNGGSSAADAERAAGTERGAAPSKGGSGSGAGKPDAPKTPEEEIAALSPAERRALHKDLYEQGKKVCYAYGPEELAKSNNLPSRDPATLARLFAEAYEKRTPALILPYQQGCLAGFKKFERNPPTN